MLELWGIGLVTKPATGRQMRTGGEVVTMEVNFQEKRRDSVKNQVIKVQAFGSTGQSMKGALPGTKVMVCGRLEISEYEWQGKMSKSYQISAQGFSILEPGTVQKTTDFNEFDSNDIPFGP